MAAALSFSLKVVEITEGALDAGFQCSARLPTGVGAHDLPEHGVVNVAAGVIADGGSNRFRDNRAVVGEQFLEALVGQFGRGFKGFIQVGHIGVVVLPVMDFHRHLVNGRLQRIGSIGQCG